MATVFRKTSVKHLLKAAAPKQRIELVLTICRDTSADDYEEDPIDFKTAYLGNAENAPKEYEKCTVWFWGVRAEDTMLIMLE